MILLDQLATDSLTVLYLIALFLIISFCVAKLSKRKDNTNSDATSTNVLAEFFINTIYNEFIGEAQELINKMSLLGINNYGDFLDKAKESIYTLLEGYLLKYIDEKHTYYKELKSMTSIILNTAIKQLFEIEQFEGFVAERYDELINAVEASAEKYEKEVSEENKSFEDGTAKVPEYIEEEEPEEKIEKEEEIDESELEEPLNDD